MTTRMLNQKWTADPTQPGRISAGDAVQIAIAVDYAAIPHSEVGADRLTSALRLVKETEALVVAAPAMAKALRRLWNAHHGQDLAEEMETAMLEAEDLLSAVGVPLP